MFAPATIDPRYKFQKQAPTKNFNLPAPTGGINARDAYTDMDAHDAVSLINVFPEANYTAVRKGIASWATGLGAPVRSMMTWNANNGSDKIFAGAGTKIWDVTASGASSSVVTGLTNVDFQWTNLKNTGGSYLIIANGADSVRSYDGTSWAIPAITGATSSTFINVTSFKERLWFAVKDSLDVYYLDTQAIAGPAHKFPLGAVFQRGGYVIGMGSFSNDAGIGPDDFLCFVSSNGEVAVYQGTDPTSATTWSLVGRFVVGQPLSRRCTVRWNGDLAILTQDGVISMQAALQFSRESIQKASITGKIQTLFSQYAQNFRANFGWMLNTYPKCRYLIVNIPTTENSASVQLVMNTITGSWCQFTGLNTMCWGVANDNLYMGGVDGTVYQANSGYRDVMAPIQWQFQTAWQMVYGASNKRFTMVRPTLLVGPGVRYAITVDTDFDTGQPPTGLLPALASSAPSMVWGWTWPGVWGGADIVDQRWQTVGAIGTWSSVHMVGTVSDGAMQCNSFEMGAQLGGPL